MVLSMCTDPSHQVHFLIIICFGNVQLFLWAKYSVWLSI